MPADAVKLPKKLALNAARSSELNAQNAGQVMLTSIRIDDTFLVGDIVGDNVGEFVGLIDGDQVGDDVGIIDGDTVGLVDGDIVGPAVGDFVGDGMGEFVRGSVSGSVSGSLITISNSLSPYLSG
jgi:hypothetical protein